MLNFNFKETLQEAQLNKKVIGHFNISNFEMFKAIFLAGEELSKTKERQIPIIIGLSESERNYIGTNSIAAFIKAWRKENNYPIFINADHCHSYESAEEAVEAGFDSVVLDNSKLSFAENIEATKSAVSKLKQINPNIVVEGEIGFIGGSSKLLDEIPEDAEILDKQLTTADEAKEFIEKTEVDLLAPAVGNIHGVLKNSANPKLNIEKIKNIIEAIKTPIVLHGGSGISNEDIKKAIETGISIIHISTDLRMSYRDNLKNLATEFFTDNPNEIAPYKIMQNVITPLQKVIMQKLEFFEN